jgi:uncharacterized protein (TIGR03083 family)
MDRDVAMRLAATEYERVVAMLEQLTPRHWSRPTVCPGWDVRAMAGHMLGMAQMITTVPELARQQMAAARTAKATGKATIDALTELQVAKNAHLTAAQLVDGMRSVGPRAARRRRRIPSFIRGRSMPEKQIVGDTTEPWTFGYLFDVILTRDPFMHRLDIAAATDLPITVSADHEGAIVDDVVREWAVRHGRPYTLELSGPAGGSWGTGDGERITMDALDFCRSVCGRGPAPGLLAHQVPF